jgi:hypothetical protein
MGLDIKVYRRLNLVEAAPLQRDLKEGEIYVWISPFPDHAERSWDLRKGIYTHEGSEFSFRAGSYTGYNDWRDNLAFMIGTIPEKIWANPVPGPFMELINFSDCDGTIGPAVSKKLYGDFRKYLERARHLKDDGGWFFHRYKLWMKAFKIASDAGCVDFG